MEKVPGWVWGTAMLRAVGLSEGNFCPPGDIWWVGGATRGQGCCQTFTIYRPAMATRVIRSHTSVVPSLRTQD
jgi:hypothetical protein